MIQYISIFYVLSYLESVGGYGEGDGVTEDEGDQQLQVKQLGQKQESRGVTRAQRAYCHKEWTDKIICRGCFAR